MWWLEVVFTNKPMSVRVKLSCFIYLFLLNFQIFYIGQVFGLKKDGYMELKIYSSPIFQILYMG